MASVGKDRIALDEAQAATPLDQARFPEGELVAEGEFALISV